MKEMATACERLTNFFPKVERRGPAYHDMKAGNRIDHQFKVCPDIRNFLGFINEKMSYAFRKPFKQA